MLSFCQKLFSRYNLFYICVAVLPFTMLGVGGCGGPGNTIGFEKTSPDEFAVLRKPPLTIPPDYTLRPPEPGAPGLREKPISVQAQNEVFDAGNELKADANTEGEYELLRKADALNVNPDIKKLIDEEFTIYAQESENFFETILFWRGNNLKGEVINSSLESQRLRENAALGLPPNTGNTPIIERREKALFEGIF